MTYNGYITVFDGDGKRLGRAGLEPVARALNARAKENAAINFGLPSFPEAFRVATHLGQPVIRLQAWQARDVRIAYGAARHYFEATGTPYERELTAATRRAL